MEIGLRIAKKMKEKGITVAALSRNTGISTGKLYPSVAGRRELRADEFLEICRELNLDPWEMVGRIGA